MVRADAPASCQSVVEYSATVKGVLTGHVARQELIVAAALTGRREPALAALVTDPLVSDPSVAALMLDELIEANQKFLVIAQAIR